MAPFLARAAALVAACTWIPGQGVRISEEALVDYEAATSADATARATATLQNAAHAFLSSELVAADARAVKRSRLVAGLEREGVSLEQLFSWYVLQTCVEEGRGSASAGSEAAVAAEIAGSNLEVKASESEDGPRRPPNMAVCAYKLSVDGVWEKQQISLHRGVLTYEPTSECRSSGAWSWFKTKVGHKQTLSLGDILPPSQIEAAKVSELPKGTKKVPEDTFASCIIVPLTKRDFTMCLDSSDKRDEFLRVLKVHQSYAGSATPATGKVPQDPAAASQLLDQTVSNVPSDTQSDEDAGNSNDFLGADAEDPKKMLTTANLSPEYADVAAAGNALQAAIRLEKMTQELKSTRETPLSQSGDYNAYRQFTTKQALKYFASKGDLPKEKVEQAKQLRLKVMALNARIERGVKALEKASALEWARLEKAHKGVLGALAAAAKAIGRALVDGTIASHKYMRRQWSSFKTWIGLQEDKCAKEDKSVEAEAVKSGGMQFESLKKSMQEGGQQPSDAQIQAEVGKADKVLAKLDGEVDASEAVQSLQDSGKKLEGATAGSNGDELAALAAADEHSDVAKRALERICQRSRAEESKSLKDMLKQAGNSYVLQPELGIRGVSGHVPFVSGGLEEVIDFRNREIGYFLSRSYVVGGSLGGISVGGYTGIGWKGYKQNWTLQDTYQVGIFASYGIGSPFGLASMGLTYAVDADTSGPYWVTDRKGVNGLVLGWGAGVNFMDLGTKLDVGLARKWFQTSECFSTRKEFLLALWGLTCATCTDQNERAMMLGWRTLTHLTSFPILTDLLFTVLAYNAERSAGPSYEPECSVLSTRTRDNPTYITSSVGRDLAQTMENLKSARSRYVELVEELDLVKDRDDLSEVQAYQDTLSGLGVSACPVHPKTVTTELLRKDSPFMGVRSSFLTKPAAKTNAFGTCSNTKQCPLKGQACLTMYEGDEEVNRCACQKGYCYDVAADGTESCVKPGKPSEVLLDTVDAWTKVAELEVGAAAVELEALLASAGR